MQDSAGGRRWEPGLDLAAWEPWCQGERSSSRAAATPGVPLLRLVLLLLVLLLLLLLRPSLSQLLGAAALPIPASDTTRGGSMNNNHKKWANEKNNPLETQAGAVSPFPRVKQPLGSRHRRYYRDLPRNPFCRGAAAGPAARTRGTKGARESGGAGTTPAGVARCKLGKAQPPAPPPPASLRRPPWIGTHRGRPARRRLRSADRRTDGRTDGRRRRREQAQPQQERAGGGGAAAAPLRHNAAGPLAPLPRPPNGRARTGRRGGEPRGGRARSRRRGTRSAARAHRRGRGRGHHCRGCRSRRALRGRVPGAAPGPRAPLGLTDSDPPRRPRGAPARPATRSCPRADLLCLLPYLSLSYLCCLRFSAAGLLLPSLLLFAPASFALPRPRAPAARPRPLEMKSPLTGFQASTSATSLVPKPFQGSSLNREKRLGKGENGTWARSWETVGLQKPLAERLALARSLQPPILPLPQARPPSGTSPRSPECCVL